MQGLLKLLYIKEVYLVVKEIVKTAVETKMTCRSVSPIISGGEYCYACGLMMRILGAGQELIQSAVSQPDVPSMQAAVKPFLESERERIQGEARYERLKNLLLQSKADDKLTEETLELFNMGLIGN